MKHDIKVCLYDIQEAGGYILEFTAGMLLCSNHEYTRIYTNTDIQKHWCAFVCIRGLFSLLKGDRQLPARPIWSHRCGRPPGGCQPLREVQDKRSQENLRSSSIFLLTNHFLCITFLSDSFDIGLCLWFLPAGQLERGRGRRKKGGREGLQGRHAVGVCVFGGGHNEPCKSS